MAAIVNKHTHDFSIYEKRRLKGQYFVSTNTGELRTPLILWPSDGDPFYWSQTTACILEFDGYAFIHSDDMGLLQTTFVLAQISKEYEKFNCVVLNFS